MAVELQPLFASIVTQESCARKPSAFHWSLVAFAERFAATILLLVLLPWLSMVGVVIAVLSRRSPLVRHSRVGQYGREIHVLKFRTMWNSSTAAESRHFFIEPVWDDGEPKVKLPGDPRVTSRFAFLCRRYSVDELPQLWHVVRGGMALIGPRPQTAQELRTYYGQDAVRLLAMKPGLSGLWQVMGRSSVNRDQRRKLDLFMVDNWSIRLYLHIVQATIPTILSGRDAW
jgi:exopolysaccharide production protein ExoY